MLLPAVKPHTAEFVTRITTYEEQQQAVSQDKKCNNNNIFQKTNYNNLYYYYFITDVLLSLSPLGARGDAGGVLR